MKLIWGIYKVNFVFEPLRIAIWNALKCDNGDSEKRCVNLLSYCIKDPEKSGKWHPWIRNLCVSACQKNILFCTLNLICSQYLTGVEQATINGFF